MKEIAAIIAALALFPAISSAAQTAGMTTATTSAATSVQASGGRVYVVDGNVFVAQGKNPAHRVKNNEAIVANTLISTGEKSSALLKFEDGQVVTMQASSTFQVREYRYDAKKIEKSKIVFSMLKGGMRFITGLIGQQRKQAFRLVTPNATIGIRGTEFMVATVGNSMYSQVLTGNIGLTNAAGTTLVSAGQTAVVASTGALATLVSASAIPAGTFSKLLSIPVQPSAISAPSPASVPVAAVVPPGVVKGALADKVGSGPVSKEKPAKTTSPAASIQKPAEPAKAADQKEKSTESKSGKGLTGKIGTLGYGGELNFAISDNISARVGGNAYVYRYNANSSSVNYDFKLRLQTASALVDWYPFEGGFRTSAGLLYNNNKVTLRAKPTGGNYVINGVTYTTTQIGSMQGTMTFYKAAPYLGIGWGNPVAKNKGWGLVSDVGILFQGKPKLDLVVTCATTCPAQLQTDATAENAKLQKDLSSFKYWPVISLGVSYQW